MPEWLASLLAQPGPAVLVTVAHSQGSVPRAPGAKMLVTADGCFDTIGGGHLEMRATEFARALLGEKDEANPPRLERFALGPTLGQCCGGVVFLAFERIVAADIPLYRVLARRLEAGQESWRIRSSGSGAPALLDADGSCIAGTLPRLDGSLEATGLAPDCVLRQAADGGWTLIDPAAPAGPQLLLFGAGHVGAAVARALAPLPCRITWIDERAELFPADVPANVRIEATDTPEALIEAAAADACFLVMTHSHALDQRLAERILLRPRLAWFGLIGSRTKRIQFERRLAARGIAPGRIAEMTCPIGLPGIVGKEPAVIAASVAAQLLQVWAAMRADAQSGSASGIERNRA